jgi:hypothetical protein
VRRAVWIAAVAAALLLGVLAGSAAGASRSVPRGFFGVMADGPLLSPGISLDGELGTMRDSGVESIRVAFYWSQAQPAQGGAFDFSASDRVVASAAQRGIGVLPVVIGSPDWAAVRPGDPASPPKRPGEYAAYVSALVGRYGPKGSFWSEHPELRSSPLRDWQIWNEPNIVKYWSSKKPFAKDYVKLLHAAATAIRKADPGAQVVLCGFANFSWRALREVYRAGGRRWFDVAAVHPFTGRVANSLKIVRLNRDVMRRYGDARKPLMLTEVTWSSAEGHKVTILGWETTEAGQAKRLTAAFRLFVRERKALRIARVYWYTWLTNDGGSPNSFDWSGLRKVVDGTPEEKPALAAFRKLALPLEGRG